MEREAQEKQAQEFLDDFKDEENNSLTDHQKNCAFWTICNKLSEHSILSSGMIDINEDDLIESLQEYLNNDYKMELSIDRERIADSQYIGKIK